jgi:GST-like protein
MIELYTAATPNGRKISICLEELGLDYEVKILDLKELEQKQEWFLKINPNGRIPAVIDKDNNQSIFESGAILMYLAEKTGKLLPASIKEKYDVIQWLMFQMSGLGPMQGQFHVFYKYFDEEIPKVIDRYKRETLRLYQVVDNKLSRSEYICNEFSIADIAVWPWINSFYKAKLDLTQFEHLNRWFHQLAKRPAFIKGNSIPVDKDDKEKKAIGRSMLG